MRRDHPRPCGSICPTDHIELARMFERAIKVLAGIPFVIGVALIAIWIRSYWSAERFFWESFKDEEGFTRWTQNTVAVGRGGVGYNRITQSFPEARAMRESVLKNRGTNPEWGDGRFYKSMAPAFPNFRFAVNDTPVLGFRIGHFSHGSAGTKPRAWAYQVIVPLWFLLLLSSALPLFAGWRAAIRWRRCAAGFCANCGYDLRASRGRCPECGTAIVSS